MEINNNTTDESSDDEQEESKSKHKTEHLNPFLKFQDIDPEDPTTYRVKIADFGNGCWIDEHFTDDVQTRQYRAPEIILSSEYGSPIDIWSMGCITFELLTGDLLFEPKGGSHWGKNDDHLAQMIELLGNIPKKYIFGKRANEFFDSKGELKNIKKLKLWPLERVLVEKYKFSEQEATEISNFILPMLNFNKHKRATASELLKLPFVANS